MNSCADLPRVLLSLHGYPSVSAGGRHVALPLKRGLALLAYLADQARPVGRDMLAALLWPDAPAGLARGRLRRLAHEVNAVLGAGVIDANPDSLWLAADVDSDLRRSGAAIAAADLPALLDPRAADVLAGFTLGSEAFDDWVQSRRREQHAALTRALTRAIERALDADQAAAAEQAGEARLRLEPCAEAGHVARLLGRAERGDAAGVETAYFEGARTWRDELGARPSARFEAAYARALGRLQTNRREVEIAFAPTASGHVAHACWGPAAEDGEAIVVMWGLMTNIEVGLDEPRIGAMLDRLARRHRVIMIDRRGMGLSERIGVAPDAASATEDVSAVLDHLGLRRAWLFGSSAGGTMALDMALRRPDRVAGLLLFGTSASGHWTPQTPWALNPRVQEAWLERLCDPAHYAEGLRRFAPSVADDPRVRAWYARLLRNAASRVGVAALLRAFQALDLRPRLGAVRVPTLVMQRRGDCVVPLAAGEQLASGIPGAELERLDGDDHFLWHGDSGAVVRAIERFVARHRSAAPAEAIAA